jgi:hypothetical protein
MYHNESFLERYIADVNSDREFLLGRDSWDLENLEQDLKIKINNVTNATELTFEEKTKYVRAKNILRAILPYHLNDADGKFKYSVADPTERARIFDLDKDDLLSHYHSTVYKNTFLANDLLEYLTEMEHRDRLGHSYLEILQVKLDNLRSFRELPFKDEFEEQEAPNADNLLPHTRTELSKKFAPEETVEATPKRLFSRIFSSSRFGGSGRGA